MTDLKISGLFFAEVNRFYDLFKINNEYLNIYMMEKNTQKEAEEERSHKNPTISMIVLYYYVILVDDNNEMKKHAQRLLFLWEINKEKNSISYIEKTKH